MAMVRPVSTILGVAIVCVVLGGLGFGGFQFYTLMSETEYVLKLPDGATDVREFHWADGVVPDFEYLLRAEIDEADFAAYVEELGPLTLHTPERKYGDDLRWLDWSASPRFDGDWWNPSDSLDGTWVNQSKELWEYAKYENGFVYVKALHH